MRHERSKLDTGGETYAELDEELKQFAARMQKEHHDTPIVVNHLDESVRYIALISQRALDRALESCNEGELDISLDTTFSLSTKGFLLLTVGINDKAHRSYLPRSL